MSDSLKLIAAVTVCFIFVTVGNSSAGQLRRHTGEAGPEVSHIKYEEPDFMEEEGWMYGIVGSYTYHSKLMLKAEGRYSYGQLDYSSRDTGTMDNIDNYIFEIRGLGGYDFAISEASFLTPYIGLGYRYLNDDSYGRVTSTGAYGYERESNYIYSPIGGKFIADLTGVTYREGGLLIAALQRFGFEGITLGNTIIGRYGRALSPNFAGFMSHELVHVGQWNVYGVSFAARYIAESARHGYEKNRFEREARDRSGYPY